MHTPLLQVIIYQLAKFKIKGLMKTEGESSNADVGKEKNKIKDMRTTERSFNFVGKPVLHTVFSIFEKEKFDSSETIE